MPFPFAVDDHQTRNGEHLVRVGAARLIQERDLTPERLASEPGVRVCNAPGTNHHSVAELTIGLIIMAARRLAEVDERRARRAGRPGRGHQGRALARSPLPMK